MDKNEQAPLWKTFVGGAIFSTILLALFAGPFLAGHGGSGDPCILGALGFLLGPFVIWQMIRSLNDRHDPRHAKRPPDAP